MLSKLTGIFALSFCGILYAEAESLQHPTHKKERTSAMVSWWNGKYASSDWMGVRSDLTQHGLTLKGSWQGDFLGLIDGGRQQKAGFAEEIQFSANIDFYKLTKSESLKGLLFDIRTRWRDGEGIGPEVTGTDSTFRPSAFTSGQQWRLQSFSFTYTHPELLGIKNLLTLSAGWQLPSSLFLNQPESKLFVNNTLRSAKGMSLNNIPWSGSFSTWGGFFRLNPTSWYYFQTGLYMAYPEATSESNHGLAFEGYRPDPSKNGLMFIAESGVTPALGSSKLPGKYAISLIYWDAGTPSYFSEQKKTVRIQLYWQADQMLFREPAPRSKSEIASAEDKPIRPMQPPSAILSPSLKSSRETQGLYAFSLFAYAPESDHKVPFYFHAGLVYKGLLPYRNFDQCGVAFALAVFGQDQDTTTSSFDNPQRSNEGLVEVNYRFQINPWSYVQPNFQYIFHPSGRQSVKNNTIIGLHFGVDF